MRRPRMPSHTSGPSSSAKTRSCNPPPRLADTQDSAEVVGIPVFAYDVNLADRVAIVKSAEGADVASAILLDAGNFTFRTYFETASEPGRHWRPLMTDLESLGCWFDTWDENLVAVSAAPEHAQEVSNYLSMRQGRNELQYETGRLGRQ